MRFRPAHIAIEFRPPHCHHFQPESPPTTPLVRAPPFRTLLHCNFTNLYDSVYASCPIGTSTNLASNLFVPFCTRSNNVAPLMVICCCCCSVCSTPLQVCSLFTTLYRLVFAAPPRRRRNLALRRARGLAPSPLLRAAPLVMHGGRSALASRGHGRRRRSSRRGAAAPCPPPHDAFRRPSMGSIGTGREEAAAAHRLELPR